MKKIWNYLTINKIVILLKCDKVGENVFLGTYRHSLDPKNRLTIPSKLLQNIVRRSLVISKGFDGCLEARTPEAFKIYTDKLMTLSQNKLTTRTILRQLLANASEIDLDNVNRILIPSNLLNEANLKKNIVIIGIGNKFEIWDEQKYEEFKSNSDNLLEELAEQLDNETI